MNFNDLSSGINHLFLITFHIFLMPYFLHQENIDNIISFLFAFSYYNIQNNFILIMVDNLS